MQSTRLSEKSETTAADVAGVFTAGILRRCTDARVLPFADGVFPLALNPRDSILTNARKVSEVGTGGTSLSAPIEQLLRERDRVDTFIGITDNEEWIGRGAIHAWREYRKRVAPNATGIFITPVPGKNSAIPETEPGVHFVHGWSDSVFRFAAAAAGAEHQIHESEEDDS
jgi:60 kDa SS-A/Ro ribonucleoprotein